VFDIGFAMASRRSWRCRSERSRTVFALADVRNATMTRRSSGMHHRIVGLSQEMPDYVEQAAVLLHDAFHGRSDDWQDLASARREVIDSLAPGRVSRVATDSDGRVIGWVGALPMYGDRVWELHPLVVAQAHRGQGVGRALVEDIERLAAAGGALTLWLGSDDEHLETTLGGVDLYANVPEAIRGFANVRGAHPSGFYRRLGFLLVGVMPDANGVGKPDIFFAKRVGQAAR
jgi:aminoglycoside 6'-N-acetyltransferase I